MSRRAFISLAIFTLVKFTLFLLISAHSASAQIIVRIPNKDLYVWQIVETKDGKVWLGTGKGAFRVDGDKGKWILDLDLAVRQIEETKDGKVWLGTRGKGAFRVDGDKAKRIPDMHLYVNQIVETKDGKVWLGTGKGAFRVDGDKGKWILDLDLAVRQIEETKDGKVWLGTGKGLFRVADRDLAVRQILETRDGKVWLGTGKGAFRVDGDKAKRIPDMDLYVYQIVETKDGKVWLGTRKGAFRVDGDKAKRIPDMDLYVWQIVETKDGKVWLGTRKGAFRVDGDKAKRIPDMDLYVSQIVETKDGKVWLGTRKGAFRVDGDKAKRIPDMDLYVSQIVETKDGKVWLGTRGKGAFRVDGDKGKWILDLDLDVSQIVETKDGKVWLRTGKGAFRVDGDKAKRIPDMHLYVNQIVETKGGKVWLRTGKGAFRVDEGPYILVGFESADSWWKRFVEWFLGEEVLISGDAKAMVSYKGCADGGYPCGREFNHHFMIYMDTDENSLKKRIEEDRYIFSDDKRLNRLTLTAGMNKIHYAVRDKWGNGFDKQIIERWVVPGQAVLPIVLGVTWLIILAVAFSLAPAFTFFHNALMNPFLRKYGTFGLFPLLTTVFPPLRRFVLIRYMRSIRRDEDFAKWQDHFIIPHENFLPETFCGLLSGQRKLFLSGQSGIGKTVYFKYLMGLSASNRLAVPKDAIPVFIPTIRYQGKSFDEMFHAQLSNYGGMTDESLNKRFLEQGSFLIFIDGLNEVDLNTRQEMNRFVDQHWKLNYFCLSSQEYYQEFTWIDEVRMKTLDPEKVNELLYKRLGERDAPGVINQLTESTYEIYKIPQNLEFAIEIVSEQNRDLPKTESDLYDGVLLPILNRWSMEGRLDYSDLINKRAYEMLCSREQFFNPDQNPFPEGLLNPLAENRKFLIPREDNYIFRHDLVRGYLAAKYFASRWQKLLSDEKIIVDSNWIAMLKFAVPFINKSDELKALLFAVLERNRDLAGDVFKWLKQTHPYICEDWSGQFVIRFGEEGLK